MKKKRKIDWDKAFQEETILEWQREVLQDADRIEAGFSSRYIAIPSDESGEGYRDMEAFISTVCNPRLQRGCTAPLAGAARFDILKMCCWIIPLSTSDGFSSSRSDYTSASLIGWRQKKSK